VIERYSEWFLDDCKSLKNHTFSPLFIICSMRYKSAMRPIGSMQHQMRELGDAPGDGQLSPTLWGRAAGADG
jgi:hypothetical protein